jgi:hypothetical protein
MHRQFFPPSFQTSQNDVYFFFFWFEKRMIVKFTRSDLMRPGVLTWFYSLSYDKIINLINIFETDEQMV